MGWFVPLLFLVDTVNAYLQDLYPIALSSSGLKSTIIMLTLIWPFGPFGSTDKLNMERGFADKVRAYQLALSLGLQLHVLS